MVVLSEYVCRDCKGTGEVAIEPGGDGYNPIYGDCGLCDGFGYEIVERLVDYNGDHVYYVEII